MSRIVQGDTSSSAIRIADQLKPQQKLSASSRSLAVVSLLNPGLDGIAAPYRCGAFGRVSMYPNTVMPTAHSTIGTNAVQGRPVRSQNAPQITGVITPMV